MAKKFVGQKFHQFQGPNHESLILEGKDLTPRFAINVLRMRNFQLHASLPVYRYSGHFISL